MRSESVVGATSERDPGGDRRVARDVENFFHAVVLKAEHGRHVEVVRFGDEQQIAEGDSVDMACSAVKSAVAFASEIIISVVRCWYDVCRCNNR